jgi:hypothetical protein
LSLDAESIALHDRSYVPGYKKGSIWSLKNEVANQF